MRQNEKLLTRIHLLGMPGSGKDTNATPLKGRQSDISDIVSTGDIFRGARTPDGEYGCYHSIIKPYIENTDNGGLIPDPIIVHIVDLEIAKRQLKRFSRLIFTGYPRTIDQLTEIDKSPQNDIFVFLDCTQENAQLRIEKRYKEDLEAGRTPREDDKPEKLPKRFATFNSQTLPLVNELKTQKRLIIIDANGTVEEVSEEFKIRVKY
jgi:adenylate kinase family enzyme